jgi:hypothetical protein
MRLVLALALLADAFAASGFAPAPPQGAPRPGPPATVPAAPADYVFTGTAGMLFFYVRPDKTTDFEAVMQRLGAALDASLDPARRQQASGWRIFRSAEAPRDAVIYILAFDPAIAGADYDPIKILGEAAPTEVQGQFEILKASVIKVERMGLVRLR